MDDKELLMNAAKAVGGYVYIEDMGWIEELPDGTRGAWWSPLTDDGDALRLSVKLGLESYHTFNDDHWCVFVGYPVNQRIVYVSEPYELDEYAATRRCIVRAAAEIGRGM